MNSQMEEQYEKPRQCGWKILKDALAEAHEEEEEERQSKEKEIPKVCGLFWEHLLRCPQEEFEKWIKENKDKFSIK